MPIDAPNYQYPEDIPHVSGDRGTVSLVVRKDTDGTLASNDGDYTVFQVDSQGKLKVTDTEPQSTGTLNNGVQTIVAAVAVSVLAANPNRKKVIIQNVGNSSVRVGSAGVTASTGVRLLKDGHLLLEMPNCPINEIFAIRETANSVVLAQEIV